MRNSSTRQALFIAIGLAGLLFAASAHAQATLPADRLVNGLLALINLLNSRVAAALAILAVMGFGIGALSGQVDWIKALQVILAIGVIFSAASLVTMFTGQEDPTRTPAAVGTR